jgi:hypothetical protein
MRALLQRLGPRLVAAAVLTLLIAAAVAIGRLAGEPRRTPVGRPAPPATATVDPTAGDDGVVAPTPTRPPSDAAALRTATTFAERWLRRDLPPARWHARLAELTTAPLAAELDGVDPRDVPASRMDGEARSELTTQTYVRVLVPMDTGTLVLKVFRTSAGWKVGEVDWEPA